MATSKRTSPLITSIPARRVLRGLALEGANVFVRRNPGASLKARASLFLRFPDDSELRFHARTLKALLRHRMVVGPAPLIQVEELSPGEERKVRYTVTELGKERALEY